MDWVRTHRRSAVLIGLTLLVPMYVFVNILASALSARSEIREQIEFVEPRVARMRGLIEKEPELRSSLSGISTVISDHIYGQDTAGPAVAASLQAEARRILDEVGMQVTNSQVLPPRKRSQFDYIAVKVVASGTLEQLNAGLLELATFRPIVFVESVDTFPNRRRRRDEPESQTLTVSLQLLSLRAAS